MRGREAGYLWGVFEKNCISNCWVNLTNNRFPTYTLPRHWPTVGATLGQWLRRWTNISPILDRCLLGMTHGRLKRAVNHYSSHMWCRDSDQKIRSSYRNIWQQMWISCIEWQLGNLIIELFKPYGAEIRKYINQHGDKRVFSIWNHHKSLVGSFRFTWIPMSWVYGHYKWCTLSARGSTLDAGPDGSFVSTGACKWNEMNRALGHLCAHIELGLVTWGYQVRIPVGTDMCHSGCAYTVLQTVQRHGVYSAAYDTVHYKEPLKSFEISIGHSPGFGLPSVAILPWLCRKQRKAIVIYIDFSDV